MLLLCGECAPIDFAEQCDCLNQLTPGVVNQHQLPNLLADRLIRHGTLAELFQVLGDVAPAQAPWQASSHLQHSPPHEMECCMAGPHYFGGQPKRIFTTHNSKGIPHMGPQCAHEAHLLCGLDPQILVLLRHTTIFHELAHHSLGHTTDQRTEDEEMLPARCEVLEAAQVEGGLVLALQDMGDQATDPCQQSRDDSPGRLAECDPARIRPLLESPHLQQGRNYAADEVIHVPGGLCHIQSARVGIEIQLQLLCEQIHCLIAHLQRLQKLDLSENPPLISACMERQLQSNPRPKFSVQRAH